MRKRIIQSTLLIFFITLGFVQTTKYTYNKNILHNETNINNNNFVEKDNNLEIDIKKIIDILRYPGVSINNIRKEELLWKGEISFLGDINILKEYLVHLNNNKINIKSYKIEKNNSIIGYLEVQFS